MKKFIKLFVTALFLAGLSTGAPLQKAKAQPVCCTCQTVMGEIGAHQEWYMTMFWEDNILPAMMLMAEQLTAVAMQQVQMIGTFLDAKHQLETQQVFEKVRARAHKDYQPTDHYGLCQIGSSAKSLAASEHKSELNAVVMSQRSQDRQLGGAFTVAAPGQSTDRTARLEQFRKDYCDPMDNNSGLRFLCDHDQLTPTPATGADKPERMNKDIDFARTIDFPWTINVDFTDQELTEHEEDVLALASNLYGHQLFVRPQAQTLKGDAGQDVTDMQKAYIDLRSVLAKRSVAENSYNAITAMKAEGLPGSREYLLGLLAELGISNDPDEADPPGGPTDAEKVLGVDFLDLDKEIEPSYYAQMEILTKKIYQNPDFYTHLMDTPANVARKRVAMQAIGLMQKFDLFKSYLRSEASLSLLLELAVMDLQQDVENQIDRTRAGGTKPRVGSN